MTSNDALLPADGRVVMVSGANRGMGLEIARRLHGEGLAILLVEQNVFQSLEIADRAYVLENGQIALSGSAAALAEDEGLKKSYLGM